MIVLTWILAHITDLIIIFLLIVIAHYLPELKHNKSGEDNKNVDDKNDKE